MRLIGTAVIFILIMIITNHKLSAIVKGIAEYVKLSVEISVLATCLVYETVNLVIEGKWQAEITRLSENGNLSCMS